ncbi:MAG: hypothetical protein IPG45_22435 [Deltaproteobacteria bacterium]|jgi:hypothetical protein|nr:hypothetical protein [Deltaproteobacteria bacterium]
METRLVCYETNEKATTTPEVQKILDELASDCVKVPVWHVGRVTHEVMAWLKVNPGKKVTSLDLIGHGSPGELSLGAEILGYRTSEDPSGEILQHVLSADPSSYVELGPLVKQMAGVPLRLLGCNTARRSSPPKPEDYWAVDGRVLMFALANMLQADIYGTNAKISSDDFKGGEFKTQSVLQVVRSDDKIPVQEPPAIDQPTATISMVSRGALATRAIGLGSWRSAGTSLNQDGIKALIGAMSELGRHYPEGDGFLLRSDLKLRPTESSAESIEILDGGRQVRWRDPEGKATTLFDVTNIPVTRRLIRFDPAATPRFPAAQRPRR